MAHTPTILVVDDDPSIRKMLAEMLSLEGYQTEIATNGREALDMLAMSGPRVILLDLLMPVLDGRGVMQALEADPAMRAKHKVILVSAYLEQENARELRADGMLAKPFQVEKLMDVLTPILTAV